MQWNVAVCAVEPFPGRTLGAEIEPRFAEVSALEDEIHLRDLHEALTRSARPKLA